MQRFVQNLIVILAIGVGFHVPVALHAQVRIELKHQHLPQEQHLIRLSDIANVRTFEPTTLQQFSAMEIDAFEGDGKEVIISREQVRLRLLIAGIDETQFVLTGPQSIVATKADSTQMRQQFERLIQQQIAKQYGVLPGDLVVSLDERLDKSLLFSRLVDFRLLHSDQAELPLGRTSITATFESADGETTDLRTSVSIAVMRDLVVATKNISRGGTLNRDNSKVIRRPVDRRNARYASIEQASRSIARSDIQQFDIIRSTVLSSAKSFSTATATAQSSEVKRNAIVNVVIKSGPLSVVLKDAKALQSGRVGERIAVLNADTKERMVGTVVDQTTVVIRR